LYLKLKINTRILTISESEFVNIIAQSFFRIPYHTQKQSPVNNTANIPKEISEASLFFMILKSCGKNETAVQIPAVIPIIVSLIGVILFVKKKYTLYSFRHNFLNVKIKRYSYSYITER
jgi:hypothetical protein